MKENGGKMETEFVYTLTLKITSKHRRLTIEEEEFSSFNEAYARAKKLIKKNQPVYEIDIMIDKAIVVPLN